MRWFSVSVRKLFQNLFLLRKEIHGWELPTKTTKIEPPRMLRYKQGESERLSDLGVCCKWRITCSSLTVTRIPPSVFSLSMALWTSRPTSAFLSKSKDASLSMCIIFVTVVFCRDASIYSFYLDLIISLSFSYRLMADGFHSSLWKWIKEWEGKSCCSFPTWCLWQRL